MRLHGTAQERKTTVANENRNLRGFLFHPFSTTALGKRDPNRKAPRSNKKKLEKRCIMVLSVLSSESEGTLRAHHSPGHTQETLLSRRNLIIAIALQTWSGERSLILSPGIRVSPFSLSLFRQISGSKRRSSDANVGSEYAKRLLCLRKFVALM